MIVSSLRALWKRSPITFDTYTRASILSKSIPSSKYSNCYLLSTSHVDFSTSVGDYGGTDETRLIYARNPKRRLFARALLGSTTVHMGYWAWYVLDFTPAVNSSNFTMVHMDPTMVSE